MNAASEHRETTGQAPSCLIVGAGMAGLTAAHALHDAAFRVQVLDKARGVGGRMATRRIGGGVFDHGAQFVTVRDPRFQQAMDRWQAAGVAEVWSDGFAGAGSADTSTGHARYRGHPGMTAIPKALAAGLDVRLGMRIESLRVDEDRWIAATDLGESFRSDSLILTPPVPQALALLAKGGVDLPRDLDARLRTISYHPCIALLALFEEPTRIPGPGGLQFEDGPIRWMADNQQKGISPEAVAVTIHASADFSRTHWESSEHAIADLLLAHAADWLPSQVQHYQMHRWRYSQPVDTGAVEDAFWPGPPPLAFAGDAFAGGRVEGAALSGWRAAQRIIENALSDPSR